MATCVYVSREVKMFFFSGLEMEYLTKVLLTFFRVIKNLLLGIWVMAVNFLLVGMIWVFCLIILTLVGVSLETRGRWTAWVTHNLIGRPISYLAGIKVEYKNAEALNIQQPFIVAANHASWIDIVVLLFVNDFLFVSKKLVAYTLPLGPMGYLCGQAFVPRGNNGSLEIIWRALRRRPTANLLIYIEGTRTKDGRMGKPKSGAAVTSFEFNRPIIPTTITGTYGILGDSPWHFLTHFKGGEVTVTFHKPVYPVSHESASRMTEYVAGVIHSAT